MNKSELLELFNSLDCKESFEVPQDWCAEDYNKLELRILSLVKDLKLQLNLIGCFKGTDFYQDSSFCASVSFSVKSNNPIVLRFSNFGSLVYIFLGEDILDKELEENLKKLLSDNKFVFVPKDILLEHSSTNKSDYTWEERFFGYS